MKKILLVSSSSGGHIYPCLTLGEKLKRMGYSITYLGIKGEMEEKIIPNIELLDIPKSYRKTVSLSGLKRIYNEKEKISRLIKENDVIICFGGFITSVVAYFNLLYHKKLLLHEQNVILGDSIKFSYPLCHKLLISFNNELNKKRKAIYANNPTTVKIEKKQFINLKKPRVMFIFGSLSSSTCLEIVKKFILSTKLDNEFVIVTGEKFYEDFLHIKKENVKIKKFIKMDEALKNCDLVFTRGGATTLMELLKANVEIVCIPSNFVKHNHQFKNAKYLKNKGYIDLIEEKNFNTTSIENSIINLQKKNTFEMDVDPITIFVEAIEND